MIDNKSVIIFHTKKSKKGGEHSSKSQIQRASKNESFHNSLFEVKNFYFENIDDALLGGGKRTQSHESSKDISSRVKPDMPWHSAPPVPTVAVMSKSSEHSVYQQPMMPVIESVRDVGSNGGGCNPLQPRVRALTEQAHTQTRTVHNAHNSAHNNAHRMSHRTRKPKDHPPSPPSPPRVASAPIFGPQHKQKGEREQARERLESAPSAPLPLEEVLERETRRAIAKLKREKAENEKVLQAHLEMQEKEQAEKQRVLEQKKQERLELKKRLAPFEGVLQMHSGRLSKIIGKKRHCRLNKKERTLVYWRGDDYNKGKAKFLDGVVSCSGTRRNTMNLVYAGGQKTMTLKAASKEECKAWLEAFEHCINYPQTIPGSNESSVNSKFHGGKSPSCQPTSPSSGSKRKHHEAGTCNSEHRRNKSIQMIFLEESAKVSRGRSNSATAHPNPQRQRRASI